MHAMAGISVMPRTHRWRWAAVLATVLLTMTLAIPTAGAYDDPGDWEWIDSAISDDATMFRVWTGEPGVAYTLVNDGPDATVLRWDGVWTTSLTLPAVEPDALFGTGPGDLYLSVFDGAGIAAARLYHFDGTTWDQDLSVPAVTRIRSISGTAGDIQLGTWTSVPGGTHGHVYRNTGSGWTEVYDSFDHAAYYDPSSNSMNVHPNMMTHVGAGEAYLASCWGHGWWNPTDGWAAKSAFDFCDIKDMWGARDGAGDLHLWTIGNNNFSNGVRIWGYDEPAHSFGSKYGYEFSDGGGSGAGSGSGIWGSSWNDVYATGYLHDGSGTTGHIYHNDGTGWTELTAMGSIDGYVHDVWGTGPNDVWFVVGDGLLHLGGNHAPVADANGPYLVAAGTSIGLDGTASNDPDGDALTNAWTADAGTFDDATSATPTYTAPPDAGTYDVTLTVDDGRRGESTDTTYVVVYDPSGGFVTGGGWIDSPADALVAEPTLEGRATFGFVSKYAKGASVPNGNTDFQFATGDLDFHSTSYDWLVVTGRDFARFKGTGTINDAGEYRFQVWAGDGEPDTFRIRIWEEDAAGTESVVYDNDADQPITRGNIVVHTGKR